MKHGMSYDPTYRTWSGMKARCRNKKNPNYPQYGGRGITVCARWDSFENFLADMGRRPLGTTIDRRDSDGNYEPSNCRWATHLEQMANKKTSVYVECFGKRLKLSDWAKETGLDKETIRRRLKAGLDPETALTFPTQYGLRTDLRPWESAARYRAGYKP